MGQVITEYSVGDLVRVGRCGDFTLCQALHDKPPSLRECPVKEHEIKESTSFKDIFKNLEGKMALVVYVVRNRLTQAVGYRVLVEGHELFCKAIVADKYFKLVGTQGDESR